MNIYCNYWVQVYPVTVFFVPSAFCSFSPFGLFWTFFRIPFYLMAFQLYRLASVFTVCPKVYSTHSELETLQLDWPIHLPYPSFKLSLFFGCCWIGLFLFLSVLGVCCCVRAFSSCDEPGPLSSWGAQASHCGCFSSAAHGPQNTGFSTCGPRAELLCSLWDLPQRRI